MALQNIIVVNTAPGCNNSVVQQITVVDVECFLVRIPPESDAVGPFDVYVDSLSSTPYFTSQTRLQMIAGVVICLGTQTPTPTPTPTATPGVGTQTPTPTSTLTPTPTPSNDVIPSPTPTTTTTPTPTPTQEANYFAYLFPEPLDATSGTNLGQYMFDNGATWFGYYNTGTPGTTDYSSNLNTYAQYPGWSGGVDEFITPVTSLTSLIRQPAGSGTDSFGCPQNQYTFGTIRVTTSQVNVNEQYYYSIWIPLAGVGGSMTNTTVDITSGSACGDNILSDGIPDPTLAGTNVIVTAGAAIPAGTYRVLWLGSFATQPSAVPPPPLSSSLFFKGDTKY